MKVDLFTTEATMSDRIVFDDIKATFTIEQAIPMLNLSMRPVNTDQFRGNCPACKTTDDRKLVLTKSKGSFYCFQARKGGSVLDLVMHIRGGSVREAGIAINEWRGKATVPEEQRGVKEAARSFQPSTVNLAQIADRLDREHEECQKLNLSADTLKHFGAGYEKKGVARGNVIVQLHDANGVLRGYVGIGKPWFPSDLTLTDFVFNWHRVEEGELYLMRTPLEVMQAFEAGIENAISFLTPDIGAVQLKYLASLLDEKGSQIVL